MRKHTILCLIIAGLTLSFFAVTTHAEEFCMQNAGIDMQLDNDVAATEENLLVIRVVSNMGESVTVEVKVDASNYELMISGEQKAIYKGVDGTFDLPRGGVYVAYARICEAAGTLHAYMEFNISESGALQVLNNAVQQEGTTSTFTNTVGRSSGTIYESENNGSMAMADRTYHDKDNYGAISSMTDEDWWVVSFDFDGIAAFWLCNIPTGCDYDLALWDDTGTAKKYSSNSGTTAEYFTYEVEADRDYYIQITGWEGANDPNNNYWFRTKNNPQVDVSVTLHQQEESDTCGSACGVMILGSLSVNVSENSFTQWNKNANGSEFTYVYAVCNTINHFLSQAGSTVRYSYVSANNMTDDEKMFLIAESLTAGCPVTIPLTINEDDYFPYSSNGHYVVVGGLLYDTSTSKEMAIIYDSHDVYCAVRTVPLNTIFEYSDANSGYVICT